MSVGVGKELKFLTFYLYRLHLKDAYSIGNLYCTGVEVNGKNSRLVENQYLCNILEDKFRGNDLSKCKVAGQTCIPEGNYKIIMSYSPRFDRELPLLVNVPFFSGVRIHSGTTAEHTEGCLLPGENKVVGKVINSMQHTAIIINKIKQYDSVNIVIKNG